MKPTRRRDSMSPPLTGLPNRRAVPSVSGNSPVSIFIVGQARNCFFASGDGKQTLVAAIHWRPMGGFL